MAPSAEATRKTQQVPTTLNLNRTQHSGLSSVDARSVKLLTPGVTSSAEHGRRASAPQPSPRRPRRRAQQGARAPQRALRRANHLAASRQRHQRRYLRQRGRHHHRQPRSPRRRCVRVSAARCARVQARPLHAFAASRAWEARRKSDAQQRGEPRRDEARGFKYAGLPAPREVESAELEVRLGRAPLHRWRGRRHHRG